MSYCKYITKNHCNDDKCLERHTETLFVNPFKFYMYIAVEDDSHDNYYTYDFQFYYLINYFSDGKIYKSIFQKGYDGYKYFSNDIIDYVNII